MHILVAGVRHRNAPIQVREKFAFSEQDVLDGLAFFKAAPGIHGAAIVTTCNRTEIYITVEDTEAGFSAIRQFYLAQRELDIQPYQSKMFQLMNDDAAV